MLVLASCCNCGGVFLIFNTDNTGLLTGKTNTIHCERIILRKDTYLWKIDLVNANGDLFRSKPVRINETTTLFSNTSNRISTEFSQLVCRLLYNYQL